MKSHFVAMNASVSDTTKYKNIVRANVAKKSGNSAKPPKLLSEDKTSDEANFRPFWRFCPYI